MAVCPPCLTIDRLLTPLKCQHFIPAAAAAAGGESMSTTETTLLKDHVTICYAQMGFDDITKCS